jgi:membrane protease YdiL (CAAX protease family)
VIEHERPESVTEAPEPPRPQAPLGYGLRPAPDERAERVFPNLRQTFLLLLLFLGFTALAGFLLSPLEGTVSRQAWFLLVVLLGEGIGVLVGLRMARWPLRNVLTHLSFSTRTLRWLLVIGCGSWLLIGSLLYGITRVFETGEQEYLMDLFTVDSVGQFVLLFLTVAVAAPVLEELLVRGILLRGLSLNWGVRAGVLWSAFFFALLHLNPLQAMPAFVNGVVWAIVLLRTGSLGTTLFLHALNNGFVFVLVQLSLRLARGGREAPPGFEVGPAAGALAALGLGLLGVWLVRTGLAHLPPSTARLASFWAVSPEAAEARTA